MYNVLFSLSRANWNSGSGNGHLGRRGVAECLLLQATENFIQLRKKDMYCLHVKELQSSVTVRSAAQESHKDPSSFPFSALLSPVLASSQAVSPCHRKTADVGLEAHQSTAPPSLAEGDASSLADLAGRKTFRSPLGGIHSLMNKTGYSPVNYPPWQRRDPL